MSLNMRKVIKKYGGAAVIVLTKEDLRCYNLGVNDVIDFVIAQGWKGGEVANPPKPAKKEKKPETEGE